MSFGALGGGEMIGALRDVPPGGFDGSLGGQRRAHHLSCDTSPVWRHMTTAQLRRRGVPKPEMR
ncbi:MAG: hypothetical protein QOD93_6427 [Acetobacteraceae bacterium]|jgi:hypothetical protein|nr:hypothetical protein [Acetobacteraceae bacterium]